MVMESNRGAVVRAGDAKIDFATREIRRAGSVCKIEPRAALVLAELVAANGAVVSRAALIKGCWEDERGSDEALSQALAQVRRALADDFRRPRFIATVNKGGYRWLAPSLTDSKQPALRTFRLARWPARPMMLTGVGALAAAALLYANFSGAPVADRLEIHKTVSLVAGKTLESVDLRGDPRAVREEAARIEAERRRQSLR